MSWAQRRGPSRPTSTGNPPVQVFNPIQHSNTEWQAQAWQPPQQQPPKPELNQTQPYWQQPQQNYPLSQTPNSAGQYQQYGQQEQTASTSQNPQTSYNQQGYGNVHYSQQYDQNNLYPNQQHQASNEWGNWGWGDDDNSNAQPVVSQQPQSVTNQSIGESFANDQSWDWSVMEQQQVEESGSNVNIFPTIGDLGMKGKFDGTKSYRKKLDTPQWSTESQPSIESSDDVLHTSESDKSHIVSRSSTISHSPISGQEISPPGYTLHMENKEITKHEENRPPRVNPTPPLPKTVQTPPLLLPPQGGASDDSRNPYKRASGLSRKTSNKFKSPDVRLPSSATNFNQVVNLETLPDNSERPDYPLVVKTGHQQWPQIENNEAPINDRNQYLETGQLSEGNLPDLNETMDAGNNTLPPPGLQRMVPGQTEVGGGQPLPGFSRMVLGQNESTSDATNQNPLQFDMSGPPEGLHRMVPGESSSPETSLRQQNVEENDSEVELTQNHSPQPQRSATIGADTPPILSQTAPNLSIPANRSETIGSDLGASVGGDASDTPQTTVQHKGGKQREAVEGQTTETVSSLTIAVRNLTVGENLTDGHTSNNSLPELSPRRHSRQESSESESERKNQRNNRDKWSAEKGKSRERERGERDRYRNRNTERYSPDPYRDKRDSRNRRPRDRRYEEDTDYYSDKERRGREDRERDYERKYSSLRKEKDRRRKDRDPRDYRESRRGDYYYQTRYRDEYGADNRSSRPSSRSDSIHESYRERREGDRDRRPRDRDRYKTREHRDVYNPYQNFAYDPYNPYYQQYQYYENLRRTNPQAYAEWYRKYYQQATGSTAPSYAGEDRASVHSGRSSANDELAKDRYTRQSFYSQSNYYGQAHSISGLYGLDNSSISYNRTLDQTDNSLLYEEQKVQRLTPAKFATAHLKASISTGNLIRILPNYPMDGQNAIVDVCNLQSFLENDPDYIELSSFPGPLIKGVTHKKQIIEYCDTKIRDANCNRDIADVDSYILMWELLILLLRQNGMVVGTDIAELLLKNRPSEPAPRPPSALSTTSSNVGDKNENSETSNLQQSEHGSTQSILKEEEVTRKFREFLLYGSCQEALDWAMKHGLWGHALFLASKLDKRTYANVMMRFANGLTMNDPLQTLYQLLSGKMPAVVTCASDEKWGDWRPHLAMILSNSSQRPELNCKAITQLGDTLLNRGSLYAAQFCYLMAEAGFGKHGDINTRLVLLGSDHRKPFPQFITNEAIHMTEIYEFACSLNDQDFSISEFQFYKFLLSTRLADFGLLQRSLRYLEQLAGRIVSNPLVVSPVLLDRVCNLADKLKFCDPVDDQDDELEFGTALESSRPDNSWLKALRAVQADCQAGRLAQQVNTHNCEALQLIVSTENTLQEYDESHDVWQQEQQQYDQQQQLQYQEQPSVWTNEQQGFQGQEAQPLLNEPQNYWPGQQPWNPEPTGQYGQEVPLNQDQSSGFYENSNNQIKQKVDKDPAEESEQQQISLPNQAKGKSIFDDEPLPHEKQQEAKPKAQSPKQESNQSTGWFGGIFSKLSMKPKNQIKLPDDKNPKIVWDENKKQWTNLDADPNDTANEFKPPPKMTQMPGTSVVSSHGSFGFSGSNHMGGANAGPMSLPDLGTAPVRQEESMPAAKPTQSNMFKMQKNRNVKNAYVDVFKQNGVKSEPVPAPEQVPIMAPTEMNFFIPQPMANSNAPVDFLTPGGALAPIGESQISRWSSTSSLSREVASYMSESRR
ncbi:protein transport protein Sec16B isoform X3 [Euwallacea fornicatus]|uniref:protein transport protein Sec16B isoform X3 n=1 Tax=Euwallacea fornicatus TaxID=995702 RepID=UPI00338D3A4C